jgi:hypothetical protein
VQGTEGAQLSKDLKITNAELIIRKGFHNDVDSYSAFLEADKKTRTGLASYLKERAITTVFVTGLARPTSAWPGPRSTPVTPALPPMWSRMHAAASTPPAHWPRPGPT